MEKVPVISIIDDDESVRLATGSLVQSLGFVACTFASAEDFLQSPRANETSCLITDVQMPGMSGVDLQSLLISEGRETPVIFITALAEEGTRARSLEAGAVCFLHKPFDGATLIECLHTALKRHGDRSVDRTVGR